MYDLFYNFFTFTLGAACLAAGRAIRLSAPGAPSLRDGFARAKPRLLSLARRMKYRNFYKISMFFMSVKFYTILAKDFNVFV